jgi:hypothetical protein
MIATSFFDELTVYVYIRGHVLYSSVSLFRALCFAFDAYEDIGQY